MRGVSTQALAVAASITASGSGTSVDVGQYQGIALLVLNSGAVNAGTNTIRLQHSADGTTGWADTGDQFAPVTTVASTGQQEIMVNADKFHRFVRVVDTLAGGATAVVRSVMIVGRRKYA